jgi:hypothetical protein
MRIGFFVMNSYCGMMAAGATNQATAARRRLSQPRGKRQNFTADQAGGTRHARSLRSSIGPRMRHRH